MVIPIRPIGPRIRFRNIDDRAVMPLDQLCATRRVAGGCGPGRTVQISVGSSRTPMTFELRDFNGRAVAPQSRNPGAPYAFSLQPLSGARYFLVGVPSGDAIPGRDYDVPLTIRSR
jgi:hypothetical protein